MKSRLFPILLAGAAFYAVSNNAFAITAFPSSQSSKPVLPASGAITKAQAKALVRYLDATEFGGFFQDANHSWRDVLGIWSKESNFNANNYNPNDPSGAYGIGQVLATTAAQFGYSDPTALFNPEIGARVSLEYLRWSWSELARRLGRSPTNKQWIMAYNAGAAGVASGRSVLGYYLDVKTRATLT